MWLMDLIKLLLIWIIFTLARFHFVKAEFESQVATDLIDQFNEKPEWKNCLIITLDLIQELALKMVSCVLCFQKWPILLKFVF